VSCHRINLRCLFTPIRELISRKPSPFRQLLGACSVCSFHHGHHINAVATASRCVVYMCLLWGAFQSVMFDKTLSFAWAYDRCAASNDGRARKRVEPLCSRLGDWWTAISASRLAQRHRYSVHAASMNASSAAALSTPAMRSCDKRKHPRVLTATPPSTNLAGKAQVIRPRLLAYGAALSDHDSLFIIRRHQLFRGIAMCSATATLSARRAVGDIENV